MAFTNLYVDAGGNDMAAGTVVNAAASVTSTNGSWDITAETFIATGGTPFSAVQVGEWASIYVDGTTSGAVYVAQVTTINSGGLSITLSTTAKYGTKPASGATGKSCKVGGSWLSELPLTTITGTIPASTKINIKQATYTLAASRTIALAGTTTAPLWFSGYNTTPGDLDTDTTNSLSRPVFALNATFLVTVSGVHQIWSSLNVTGNRSGSIFTAGASTLGTYVRMRFDNASSNAAAVALTLAAGSKVAYCWAKCPATATTTGTISVPSNGAFLLGVVAEGGAPGFNITAANGNFTQCISLNSASHGFSATGPSSLWLFNCTVYNATTDGIRWTTPTSITQFAAIIGCLFATCGGIGINQSSGTNTNLMIRACNDFYSCSGGNEVGFGDSPAFFGQTDGSSPVTSATDMTPVVGSSARNNGFPGIVENETFSSYLDIGAVRHADPTAAGGVVAIFGGG